MPSAAELVASGTVFSQEHSDLCGRGGSGCWHGDGRMVGWLLPVESVQSQDGRSRKRSSLPCCEIPKRTTHLVPFFVTLMLASLLAHPGQRKRLKAGFDDSRFPVNAATFLSELPQLSSIRLYSSWQWGEYLIYRLWPSLRVFDDGRTDFYGPAFVEEGLLAWNVNPEWSNVLGRYRVNAILLPIDSPLATVLKEKPEWRLIYRDRMAVLFAKSERSELHARYKSH